MVKKRLEVYNAQTQPLIEHYSKKKLILSIDAYPEIQNVTAHVLRELGQKY